MNLSSPLPSSSSSSSTPTTTQRGPSSHHEFFAKLYGSFDVKTDDNINNVPKTDDNDNVNDEDDEIDVESDSDVSTNGDNSSTKNELSPTQKLTPNSPHSAHPTPGKIFYLFFLLSFTFFTVTSMKLFCARR